MIPPARSTVQRVVRNTQRTTTPRTSTTSHRHRRRAEYPEALPSLLPECYKGTANGIAVIGPGEGPTGSWEATLELVDPLREEVEQDTAAVSSTLLSPNISQSAGSIPRSPPPTLRSAGRLSAPRHDGTPGQPTTLSVTSPVSNRRVRSPGEALRQGGCIVFTDSYIHANPHTPVAAMVQNFNLLRVGSPPPSQSSSPAVRTVDSFPTPISSPPNNTITSTNNTSQPVVETSGDLIAQYLSEVKEQQRPVFVRRDSPTVYGRGYYYAPPSGTPQSANTSPRSLSSPDAVLSARRGARRRGSSPPPVLHSKAGSYSDYPSPPINHSGPRRNTHAIY